MKTLEQTCFQLECPSVWAKNIIVMYMYCLTKLHRTESDASIYHHRDVREVEVGCL